MQPQRANSQKMQFSDSEQSTSERLLSLKIELNLPELVGPIWCDSAVWMVDERRLDRVSASTGCLMLDIRA